MSKRKSLAKQAQTNIATSWYVVSSLVVLLLSVYLLITDFRHFLEPILAYSWIIPVFFGIVTVYGIAKTEMPFGILIWAIVTALFAYMWYYATTIPLIP
jgi:hypothetical protein